MNNNHSENSNIKQVSFIDLWRVLARYYYVILMAVVISLGSVLLYIQGNSGKLRYVSKVIIESSSYYDVNDGTYYQMFLPFTNGVKNSEFLDLFFSGGNFELKVANANRFMEIQVSSLRSANDSLDLLSSYIDFLKKEQEHRSKNRRAGILSELSLVEAELNNVNSKLLNIYALEGSSIKEINEKILATKATIKKLEEYGDRLVNSLDSISTLSESALKLLDRSDVTQDTSFQEMILIGLLSEEKNKPSYSNLLNNYIKIQEYKMELIELDNERISRLNMPETAFGDSLSGLKANPDSDWEIYMDKLRQSQLDLKMKKSELQYISDLDNQSDLRLYSDIEQTTKPASMHPILLILTSIAFGLGLGIVLVLLFNLMVSSKVINTKNS